VGALDARRRRGHRFCGLQMVFHRIDEPVPKLSRERSVAGSFHDRPAGAATLVAILLIGRELFSTRAAFIAALFFLLLPFALFYNRLALADSIVSVFGAWVLYISIKSVCSSKSGFSVLLALLLILSMLAKFPAFFTSSYRRWPSWCYCRRTAGNSECNESYRPCWLGCSFLPPFFL